MIASLITVTVVISKIRCAVKDLKDFNTIRCPSCFRFGHSGGFVSFLELKISPVAVMLVFGLGMWISARHSPSLTLDLLQNRFYGTLINFLDSPRNRGVYPRYAAIETITLIKSNPLLYH